jgi:hypothetical protein
MDMSELVYVAFQWTLRDMILLAHMLLQNHIILQNQILKKRYLVVAFLLPTYFTRLTFVVDRDDADFYSDDDETRDDQGWR